MWKIESKSIEFHWSCEENCRFEIAKSDGKISNKQQQRKTDSNLLLPSGILMKWSCIESTSPANDT